MRNPKYTHYTMFILSLKSTVYSSYRQITNFACTCTVGCSDFDFFTFWGITTHPWHPKGPRIWKLAKKFFQLHPWPAEIFGKNRKMRFFGLVSKFNIRSPVWKIFTIFSACFIYGIPNTRTKFEVSKSKTVVTREWSRQGSKFICLQNLRSKYF